MSPRYGWHDYVDQEPNDNFDFDGTQPVCYTIYAKGDQRTPSYGWLWSRSSCCNCLDIQIGFAIASSAPPGAKQAVEKCRTGIVVVAVGNAVNIKAEAATRASATPAKAQATVRGLAGRNAAWACPGSPLVKSFPESAKAR